MAQLIVPVATITAQLPSDAVDTNNWITDAAYKATAFCNSYAVNYDPFDEYNASTDATRAPYEVVHICTEIAKVFYYMAAGQIYRDGSETETWQSVLNNFKTELMELKIEPTWEEQTISLDSNSQMIIGDRNAGGAFPRVIPFRAEVISDTTNVWTEGEDWYIRKGSGYDDTHRNAWYMVTDTSETVEGTLRYMRTYKNNAEDYGKYGG